MIEVEEFSAYTVLVKSFGSPWYFLIKESKHCSMSIKFKKKMLANYDML